MSVNNKIILTLEDYTALQEIARNPNKPIEQKTYNLATAIIKNSNNTQVFLHSTKQPLPEKVVIAMAHKLQKPVKNFETRLETFKNWTTFGKYLSGLSNFLQSCLHVLTYNLTLGKMGERYFEQGTKEWKPSDKNVWGTSSATQLARTSLNPKDLQNYIQELKTASQTLPTHCKKTETQMELKKLTRALTDI